MSSGQTMLTVAFFMLVTVAVINANRMLLDSESSYYNHAALEEGSNFANALLSQTLAKNYSEVVGSTDTVLVDSQDIKGFKLYMTVTNLSKSYQYYKWTLNLSFPFNWYWKQRTGTCYYKQIDVSVRHELFLKRSITLSGIVVE